MSFKIRFESFDTPQNFLKNVSENTPLESTLYAAIIRLKALLHNNSEKL